MNKDQQQKLFNYFEQEHKVLLLESDIKEIEVILGLTNYPQTIGKPTSIEEVIQKWEKELADKVEVRDSFPKDSLMYNISNLAIEVLERHISDLRSVQEGKKENPELCVFTCAGCDRSKESMSKCDQH